MKNKKFYWPLLILFLTNFVLLFLLNQEKSKSASFSHLITELNKNLSLISNSLAQRNFKKVHFSLIEAQRNLKGITRMVKPSLPEKVVALSIPAGKTPYPFLYARDDEYLLLCEKVRKILCLFHFSDGKFSLVKTYPCIVGMNKQDKKDIGDYATPEGAYFLLGFIPAENLPEKYGYGAFTLNYPNLLDRKEKRKGGGIWLHGHSVNTDLEELLVTEGCIAIDNDFIKELAHFVKPGVTPIVVVDRIKFRTRKSQEGLSRELQSFLDSWKQAWESIDTEKYLSFYAPEFISARGMDYKTFKRHKRRVNRNKRFIRLKIEKKSILIPQKYQGEVAILRFNQDYHSNNFDSYSRKTFYLKRGEKGWRIVGESTL